MNEYISDSISNLVWDSISENVEGVVWWSFGSLLNHNIYGI